MITLRLDKNGGINKGDVQAFEHDNKSEVYIIQLYKNGAIYDLTNKSIELTMVERKRKIGDMVSLPIYNATEGKVKLEVVSDITKQDGIYDFKLTVKDTTGLIETFPNFQVEIKNDITDSITGEIIQDPNFTILTEGLKALADYNIYKTNALKVPEIEQDIVEINEQLEQKLNKDGIVTMANMGQDVKEAMTGGSVAVVGKNAILNENMVNGQVSYDKTNFVVCGDNLFNKDNYTPNKYLDNGNVTDNSNGWGISDFIPVLPNVKYSGTELSFSYFYDTNRTVISRIVDTNKTFTTPSNCFYIRLSIMSSKKNLFMLNKGETLLEFQPYKEELKYQKPINVLAPKCVGGENLIDKSITPIKTTFFDISKNLIDKNNYLNNKSLDNYSGSLIDTQNGYGVIDFFEVKPNTDYFINCNTNIHFYTTNKGWISFVSKNNATFTTPINCAYARVLLLGKGVDMKESAMLNEGTTPLPYQDFAPKIKKEHLDNAQIDIDFVAPSKNLFDVSKVIHDKYLDNGNVTDNSSKWGVSDLIPVEPNTQYILSNNFTTLNPQYSYFYNAGKGVISQIPNTTNVITTPSNCSFIRLSIANSKENSAYIMLEKGSVSGYFVKGGDVITIPSVKEGYFVGKKYVPIGDSITDGAIWSRVVSRNLGMILTFDNGRFGTPLGGSRTDAMCHDNRVNLVPTDTNIVTIMGGSNDWAQNTPIGVITDTTSDTFYGAYNMLISKLYARCGLGLDIFIFEQPFRADMTPNSNGKVLEDYREATRQIAYKWGLPLIKVYQNAGINQTNYTLYLGDVVHPNAYGHNHLANVITSGMRACR